MEAKMPALTQFGMKNQTRKPSLVCGDGKQATALNWTEDISRSYSQFSSHKFEDFKNRTKQIGYYSQWLTVCTCTVPGPVHSVP